MDWTPEHLAIAFAGAFIAGIINALAGNGSVITLTILTTMIGLPGVVANGTNRVGVLLNALGAMAGFAGKRKMNYRLHVQYILPVIGGAVAGIMVATKVTSEQFMWVFKFLMVVMLFVIIANPERWLIAHAGKSAMPKWLEWPAMLILGFYGGFIQMGMGVFYLAVLVLVARLPLIESNTIKAITVGTFTLIAVIIFAFTGLIVWSIGIVMGIAQFAGGWLAAHYASKIPGASKYAYYVLLIAVSLSILKLFNVF
ncbi:MAG TPA: sulfite exporter TauE/SafE family protein [Saprospiraceae bacterium]|nr:sulfite exporter TauE/SafE family protein [Saprospiraceae bacterium]